MNWVKIRSNRIQEKQFRRAAPVHLARSTNIPRAAKMRFCLTISLQEFQRVQCFFALAIQTASIVSSYTASLQSVTIGQAQANASLLLAVTQNNMSCLAFVYWYLRRNIGASVYNTFLTWSTFIMTLASWGVIFPLSRSIGLDNVAAGQTYAACSYVNPIRACSPHYAKQHYIDNFLLYYHFGNILSSAVLLFVCACEDYAATSQKWSEALLCRYPSIFRWYDRARSFYLRHAILYLARKLLWLSFLSLVLLLFLCCMITNCIEIMAFAYYQQIDASTWTFGQIVAVTVWAQPLMEFLQMLCRRHEPSIVCQRGC